MTKSMRRIGHICVSQESERDECCSPSSSLFYRPGARPMYWCCPHSGGSSLPSKSLRKHSPASPEVCLLGDCKSHQVDKIKFYNNFYVDLPGPHSQTPNSLSYTQPYTCLYCIIWVCCRHGSTLWNILSPKNKVTSQNVVIIIGK